MVERRCEQAPQSSDVRHPAMDDLQVKVQKRIKYKAVEEMDPNFDDKVLMLVEVEIETYHSQTLHLIDWRRHGLQESSE